MAKGGDKSGRFKIRGKKGSSNPELEKLLEALKTNPGDYRTRLKLASFYLMREQKEKAVQQYILAGDALSNEGFSTKAVAAYRQAINIDPNLTNVYEKLAVLYHRLALMQEVVAMYQKVIAVHERNGQIKLALDTLQKMVDLDPKNTHGRLKLAERYYQEGYEDLAIGQFLKVYEIQRAKGEKQQAAELLKDLIERGIQHSELISGLADLCRDLEQPELFIGAYGNLAEEVRDSTEVLDKLAGFQTMSGDIEGAKHSLQKIAAFYRLAEVRERELDIYSRILEIDPDDEEALAAIDEENLGQSLVVEEQTIDDVESIEPLAQIDDVVSGVIVDEPVPAIDDLEVEVDIEPSEVEAIEPKPEPEPDEIDITIEEELEEPQIVEQEELPEQVAPLEPETLEQVEEFQVEVEPVEVEPVTVEEVDVAGEEHVDQDVAELESTGIFEEEVEAEPETPELPQPQDLSAMDAQQIAAFLDQSVKQYIEAGFESEAPEFLRGCIELSPSTLETYNQLKGFLAERGRTDEAIEVLRQAVDAARNDGRQQQLREYLEDLIALEPEDTTAQTELEDLIIASEPHNALPILMARAEIAVDQSDPEAAIGWLDKIFQIDAENLDAHALAKDVYLASGDDQQAVEKLNTLADLLIARGEQQQAEAQLHELIDLTPQDPAAHIRLAELYQSTGDIERQSIELLTIAELYVSDGEAQRALDVLQQVLQADPGHSLAAERMIEMLISLDRGQEACERLLELAGSDLQSGDFERGIQRAERAAQIEPERRRARELLRKLYIKVDRTDDAVEQLIALTDSAENDQQREELLAEALNLDSSNREIIERLVELALNSGQTEQAISRLFDLADAVETANDQAKLEQCYDRVVQLDGTNERARQALKQIYIATNRVQPAAEQAQALAEMYLERNELEQAENELKELIGIAPEDPAHHERLVALLESSGREDEQAAERLVLAELYRKAGRPENAADSLERALELRPDDVRARERLIELQLEMGRRSDASRGLIELAESDLDAERLEEGLERARRALDLKQDERRARMLLRDLYVASQRYDDAVEQLLVLSRSEPDAETRRMLLGEALELDSQSRETLETLVKIDREEGLFDEAKARLFELSNIVGRVGEIDRVEDYLRQIVDIDSKNIRARQGLKDIHISRGQTDLAVEELSVLSRMSRGDGYLDQAEAFLKELLELDESQAESHKMLAEIYDELERGDQALEHWLRYARLQSAAGETEEAYKTYERVFDATPDDEQVFSEYKELAKQLGRTERVIEELTARAQRSVQDDPTAARAAFEEIVGLDENNIIAHRGLMDLLLAGEERVEGVAVAFKLYELLIEAGDADRAEATLRDVLELEPDNEQAIDRLKKLYLESERNADAVDLLAGVVERQIQAEAWTEAWVAAEEILGIDPENVVAHEKMAQIGEGSGDSSVALEHLSWLIERELQTGDLENSEQHLRKVLQIDPQQLDAHQQLKELYLGGGRLDLAVTELFSLVDKLEDDEAIESNLTQVLQYDAQNERAHRRLIEIYRGSERYGDLLPLLFSLAQIELERDNKLACEEQLDAVLEIDPDNEQALLKLKDLHLEIGESDKALAEMFKLFDQAFEREDFDRAGELLAETKGLDIQLEQVARKAIEYYLKLGLSEELLDERFSLFGILADRGDVSGAEQTMRDVLADDPQDMRAHLALRQLFVDSGSPERAVDEIVSFVRQFEERNEFATVRRLCGDLLEIDPESRPTISKLAELDIVEGETEAALERLAGLADLAFDKSERDEAEQALKRMLEIKSDHEPALARLVEFYVESGAPDKAATQIIAFAQARYEAGETEAALGRLEQAAAYEEGFDRALQREREILLEQQRESDAVLVVFRMADRAAQSSEHERIETLMRDVLSLDKSNVDARVRLQQLYFETGRSEQAIEQLFDLADLARRQERAEDYQAHFEQILEHDPDQRRALRMLADHLRNTGRDDQAAEQLRLLADAAHEAQQADEEERALTDLAQMAAEDRDCRERLLQIFSDTERNESAIETLFELCAISERAGDLSLARLDAERVLEIDNESERAYQRIKSLAEKAQDVDGQVEACFALYNLARKAQDAKAAERQMRDAILLTPESRESHANLKQLLIERDAVDEAIHEAFTLAELEGQAGDVEAVRSQYLSVLDLDSKNVRALTMLAGLHEGQGEIEQAVERLYSAADLHLELDQAGDAEELLRHALILDATRTESRLRLKDLYVRLDEPMKASIELFALADEAEAVGEAEQATEYLAQIVGIDANNMEARRRLKQAYLDTGRQDEAVAELFQMVQGAINARRRKTAEGYLREIFSIDPDNGQAKQKLAELFLASGEEETRIDGLFKEADSLLAAGDIGTAKSKLSKILAIDPENMEAKGRLNALLTKPAAAMAEARPATGGSEIFHEVDVADFAEEELVMDWGEDEEEVPDGAAEAAAQTLAEAGIQVDQQPAAEPEPEEEPEIAEPEELELADEEQLQPDEQIDVFDQDQPEPEAADQEAAPVEEPQVEQPGYTLEEAKAAAGAGEFERAGKIFEALLEQDPDDDVVQAEYEEFKAMASPGTFSEIFDEFKRDVAEHSQASEDSETHFNLGIAYREMDMVDEAIAEFEVAANDPRFAFAAKVQMGHCMLQAEQLDPAVAHFEEALQMSSGGTDEMVELRYHLGQTYRQLGGLNRALEMFKMIHEQIPSYRGIKDEINKLEKEIKKRARKKSGN
ncbi:MAG: tetratricopeptide repeat protein [Candidatus Alcyoniella australis]|nr:tetratricopeptide repeat protein [Candidatus Alcyoniella australis]